MKSKITFYLVFLHCIALYAQENLYDFVTLGDHQVGFMDTLILDDTYDYDAYGYKGQKPYFVQIWHPTKQVIKKDYLHVRDLFVYKQNASLQAVQEQLAAEYKTLFIQDYLIENLITGEENNYGNHSYEEVLDLIGELETRSVPDADLGDSDFPVIVYHNGSQGQPFENFALAEYFASRGFIFISASFELQFPDTPFGMLPYERYITEEEEESLKFIMEYARTLSRSSSVFFIGHSMGAQMGLRTFGQDTTITGMVSLETTIEFKTDNELIMEMWPEVYQKVMTEEVNYPFPILFCAATGMAQPFNFLENVNASQITFASTTPEFEHNAYLTFFYLRYFLGEDVQQSDRLILEQRLPLYAAHLYVMSNFIDGVLKNETKPSIESMLIAE